MFWQKLTRNEAMRCFQRMVNEYGEETYFTGDDKSIVEFLAGGEGLSLEIETLRDYVKDYEAAIAAAHAMATGKYGREERGQWGPGEPYGMIALAHLRLTLEAMKAPLSRWEDEYTKLYKSMTDINQAALVVQELAEIMQKNGRTEQNRPAAEIDAVKKDMEKISAFISTATEGWWDHEY